MNFSYYENLGLNEPWAIFPGYAQNYYPALAALMKGSTADGLSMNHSEKRKESKPSFVLADSDEYDDFSDNDFDSAPEGSIAVLNLRGPVMKYAQFCGPAGTVDLAAQLKKIDADENFIGTIFNIESGGGQAFAIKVLIDQMDQRTKPIVILGGNIIASAAYAIAVHGDEIIVDHPRAIIGSIGTMQFMQNIQPALEKLGVEFHEIYATDSTLKNNTYNQALKKNYGPIKKNSLDPLNKDFQDDVKAQRPGLSADKAIMQGETFMAVDAVDLGMIDQIGNLELAKSRVKELSNNFKKRNTQQNQSMNNQFTNVLALASAANPTTDQLDKANAELTLAGITHVTLVQESFITEAANTTAENTRLKAELATSQAAATSASASVTTLQSELATANQKVTDLEAQVAAFGKNPGATHNANPGSDTPPDAGTKDDEVISNLSHNKYANEALGL